LKKIRVLNKKKKELYEMFSTELGTDDLASLPDLNEEIILEQLKKRYQNDSVYVNIDFS
jgi:myosin heavy subunit